MTKILTCKCEHEGQDKMYGYHKRLCNLTKKENTYRCTVCGELVVARAEQVAVAKTKKKDKKKRKDREKK